jgi:predicted nucleic acid-binding Zn ribbon protein
MPTENQTANCLSCNKPVKGRTDKKFCNDYCRNTFNNNLKASANNMVRNINNALGKNRRILEQTFHQEEEMAKTTKEKLLLKGFQFKYITHTYTNKKGNVYFFCYDIGYLPLENNWYLLVKSKESGEKNK